MTYAPNRITPRPASQANKKKNNRKKTIDVCPIPYHTTRMKVDRYTLTAFYYLPQNVALCTLRGKNRKRPSYAPSLTLDLAGVSVFIARDEAAKLVKKFRKSQETA